MKKVLSVFIAFSLVMSFFVFPKKIEAIIVSDGTYYIRNVQTGKYLDLIPGTTAWLYPFNGTPAQQWRVVTINGITTIYSNYNNKALDARYNLNVLYPNVCDYAPNGSACQKWKLIDNGNGTHRIMSEYKTTDSIGYNGSTLWADLSPDSGASKNWIFEKIMSKDIVYSGYLNAGQVDTYYFTPSITGMYTIETFGSTDTYSTVSGNVGTMIPTASNDDDGEALNAAIGFCQTAGNTTTIKVSHYNTTSGTGSYTIQVRDQRAQIYTFNYPGLFGLNTTEDATVPANWLASMGYAVGKHQNKDASHVNEIIATTFNRFNSEVIFFSGHGNAGCLEFYDGTNYSHLYDNSTAFTSTSPRLKPMGNTKVAVWSSCYSATDPDGSSNPRLSLADRAVSPAVGARSAIGWDLSINEIAARTFTNQLFIEFGHNMTVKAAADSAANSLTWPFDNAKNYTLRGNGSTLVYYPTVNPKRAASYAISQEEFNVDIKKFDYVAYALHGDGVRYYKTINGILTNDFYDVYDDGAMITKSKNTISQSDIIRATRQKLVNPTFKAEKNIIANGISFSNLIKTDEHTVYTKINGQIIPIKIIYADYESNSGIAYQKVTCINLLDNSFIDYENICTDN